MADESAEEPIGMEALIGKMVRRVWVSGEELILDFEDGTTLQVEADKGEFRFYFGEKAE